MRDREGSKGYAQLPDGSWSVFSMAFIAPADSQRKDIPRKTEPQTGEIIYPFTAHGEPLKGAKRHFQGVLDQVTWT